MNALIVFGQDPRNGLRIEESDVSQCRLSKIGVNEVAQRRPEPVTQRDRKSLLRASEDLLWKDP